MKTPTPQEVLDGFLKLSCGEQRKLMKLFEAAMAEQEPDENHIGPPPLPEGPGKPPVGP